jgi:hypothetical protein
VTRYNQRPNRYKAAVVFGGAALDVTDFLGKMEVLALHVPLPLARPTLDAFPTHSLLPSVSLDVLTQRLTRLLGDLSFLIYSYIICRPHSRGHRRVFAPWRLCVRSFHWSGCDWRTQRGLSQSRQDRQENPFRFASSHLCRNPKGTTPTVSFPLETLSSLSRSPGARG